MIRIIHMENMAMITEAGITNNERAAIGIVIIVKIC